ncbi:MAG TPA: YggS family pyridoxal phosphate-dependent enzyme [Woeseiaceae bacterium]|nr:YggS family pyridoxal phosphate-dependent enzyme [Woeseiaceae bacterium]
MIRVTENFRKIQDLLAKSAREAGRPEDSVRLLAVTKGQPAAAVSEAVSAGQKAFGESFVQEAVKKIAEVGRDDLEWHFIGHLQSNKTRQVAEQFQWVHTVDRLKIAERLSRQRPYYATDLNVCLQVMIDPEDDKSGVTAEGLPDLAAAVVALPKLKLRGLMCIPAVRHDFEAQREPFRRLRTLAEGLTAVGIDTDTLSMGMSADFVAAIHEGATLVRIGTALFGPRRRG